MNELEVFHDAGRLETQLRAVIAREQYARATVRPLETSLVQEYREQIERQLVRSAGQESAGPLELLAYFFAIPIIVSSLKFFKHVTVDHVALMLQERERIDITTELDERIPFDDSKLADYLSVFSFALWALLFLRREFGNKAVADGAKFLNDLAGFYADGGMVFRRGASIFRRGGKPGPAITLLREIDTVQNVFPSLHIEIAVHTRAYTEDIIDAYAHGDADYEALKERMFVRVVRIIESTLLLKQHGWRDIAAGLVAISARDPKFTPERANAITDGLFQKVPEGMASEDAQILRDKVKGLYAQLMERLAEQPDIDFTEILIQYVREIDYKEMLPL